MTRTRGWVVLVLIAACSSSTTKVIDEPEWVKVSEISGDRSLWRCRDSMCRRRTRDASAFICTASDCIQQWPHLPDANEWDCHAANGPVVCRFVAAAAGVAVTVNNDFRCGPRRGHPDEQLCIDYDPDLPPGQWSCRFDPTRHGAKLCVPTTDATHAWPHKTPECWFDEDCEERACVAGQCT